MFEITDDFEVYDDIELTEEDIKSLLRAEEDIEMGRTRDALEVIKELNARYGI